MRARRLAINSKWVQINEVVLKCSYTYNYKRLSPRKWQKAIEIAVFKVRTFLASSLDFGSNFDHGMMN